MKEFEPSRHFVSNVMKEVRDYETTQRTALRAPRSAGFIRPALSIGGALLGIVNLMRIFLSVFSPAHCL